MDRLSPKIFYTQPMFRADSPNLAKARGQTDWTLETPGNGDCWDLLRGVDLWIFGHTHETRSFAVDGTRIVTNAKGYGPGGCRENRAFDPYFAAVI